MKNIFALLALCLVVVNAAVAPMPFESDDFQAFLAEIKQLNVQHMQSPMPTKEVDNIILAIEKLTQGHPECLSSVQHSIDISVNDLFDDVQVCEFNAMADAGTITKDVLLVTAEILWDAYRLAQLYKKCEAYENTAMKATCFSKFSVQIGIYVNNLRKTITDMVNNGNTESFVSLDVEFSTMADAGTITKDVLLVTAEILWDAYRLAQLYKKCEAYESSAMKATCFSKFSVQIGIYVNNLRKTITDMVNNGNTESFASLDVEFSTMADAGTITKDVLLVTAEILWDAYRLAQLYKKCEAYESSAMKATCFSKFSVQIGIYVNNLRKTITDMVNNGNTESFISLDVEFSPMADVGTITKDVLLVTAEILWDAYRLAKLYKKCEAYESSAMKATCFSKFSVQIGIYVNNLRKTITDMVNNSQQSALMEAEYTCNRVAADKALQQLWTVRATVEACIAGF